MISSRRHIRGLVAVGLAIGLIAAACSSSTPAINGLPGGNGNPGGNPGAGGTGTLASGLASNLDALDSYQFSWQMTGSSSSATAQDTGSFGISGTVVNKPVQSYKINDLGMIQILVIGTQGWTSMDNGDTWMVTTDYSDPASLKDMLPTDLYGSDFDSNANQFSVAGEETKNGIDCIHYTSKTDLGVGGAILGVSGTFKADLWVAKSGNYPVSGFYGYSASAGGQSGIWGYSFDVTHVNDASANAITAPTNVTSLPS
jgi:outer membrane lipoprotein-sorting protein